MPVPIMIGLAAASLLANLYGQKKAGDAANDQSNLVNGQIADLTSWYDTQKNQPYVDSNVGRSVINRALETFKQQAKNAESTAAVTGASDEAQIAVKGNSQNALGDVFSKIAAYGTQRQDDAENNYRSNLGRLLYTKMGLQGQQAQSGANLAGNSASFMAGLAPLFASGKSTSGTGDWGFNTSEKGLNSSYTTTDGQATQNFE